jgi:hypothetical protein
MHNTRKRLTYIQASALWRTERRCHLALVTSCRTLPLVSDLSTPIDGWLPIEVTRNRRQRRVEAQGLRAARMILCCRLRLHSSALPNSMSQLLASDSSFQTYKDYATLSAPRRSLAVASPQFFISTGSHPAKALVTYSVARYSSSNHGTLGWCGPGWQWITDI